MRLMPLEKKIKNLYKIDVEFVEPYSGSLGEYCGEIYCSKGSLVELVMLANALKLPINITTSDKGLICRHTEGIRDTNQIIFKDHDSLKLFKNELDKRYRMNPKNYMFMDGNPTFETKSHFWQQPRELKLYQSAKGEDTQENSFKFSSKG